MLDALFLEGVMLPLRTGACLVAALAGGVLVGASGPVGARGVGALGLVAGLAAAFAGVAFGLLLPTLAGADALVLAALGASIVAALLIVAARVPPAPAAGALAGVAALLAGQAAFARFLPGELPVSVTAGAALGLGIAIALPAVLVRTLRSAVRGPALIPVVAVGTRVAGSWIGAVALLMFALALAPR